MCCGSRGKRQRHAMGFVKRSAFKNIAGAIEEVQPQFVKCCKWVDGTLNDTIQFNQVGSQELHRRRSNTTTTFMRHHHYYNRFSVVNKQSDRTSTEWHTVSERRECAETPSRVFVSEAFFSKNKGVHLFIL